MGIPSGSIQPLLRPPFEASKSFLSTPGYETAGHTPNALQPCLNVKLRGFEHFSLELLCVMGIEDRGVVFHL